MAHLVSISLRDVVGKREPVNIWVSDANTVAEVQAWVETVISSLDAVTGSVIESASIRLALTLPGGLKTDPTDDYLNREGGILAFNVEDTAFRESIRIGAYLKSLSSGLSIPNTGATATLVTAILDDTDASATDAYGNLLSGFLVGKVSTHTK